MRRLRGRAAGHDEGVTLIELLVSMFLVSLMGIAIAITVSVMSRNSIAQTQKTRAIQQAAVTTDRVSRLVRAATAINVPSVMFTYADGTHLTFYADVGDPNGPELADLQVVGPATDGTMQQTITRADAVSSDPNKDYTYSSTSVVTKDGTEIDTSHGGVFTYYDSSGNVLPSPLSSTNLAQIARVRLTLIDHDPNSSANVTDTTLLYVRNVEYS
jgi:type II secretory pathway pseudopilin PulG